MFETLVCQYLNKLPKGEVRNLTPPKAFHTRKVQRLGGDKVKPSAQIRGKFEMPIFALVGDMPIQPCELTNRTPPVARAFDFTREAFVECSELLQGLFQELGVLDLLTRVEGQKSVFHAEVCAYTFTRSRQHFLRCVVGHDIEPIRANTVAKDLEITHVSLPSAVLMQSQPTFIKLQSLRGNVPRFEGQTDASIFKFVACLELRRTVAPFAFELGFACAFSMKKAFPSNVQSDNHSVKRVAGDPYPVFLGALEQLRQMRLQAETSRIFTINPIVAIFQLQKMVVDLAQVVKHIPQAFVLRMFAYLIFVGSQKIYQLPVFNPYTVGRQTRNLAITLCMSANWSK